ncbi:hypothetical protein ml_43 [Mollivirus sibericum]|uniref:hypothetical protein n=1 Tax=Mollivirus sibericum TaxID=1678078 RepID=UPI0006B2DA37|nr:hypothetical protein ml_43 [Mollivirus sibericum]ALD61845.1 hypothetical protein ml_43 [Mollivirus sibericum]
MNTSVFLLIALACLGLMTTAVKADGSASITCSGVPVTVEWASSGNIQVFTLTGSYSGSNKANIVCDLSALPASFKTVVSPQAFPYYAGPAYIAGNIGSAVFSNTAGVYKVTLYANSGYEQGSFNGATFSAPFVSIA